MSYNILSGLMKIKNLQRNLKVWCKMLKRAKSVVQLVYKNEGEICGMRENTFEKVWCNWKVWCKVRENLLYKSVVQAKFIK